MTDSQKTPDVLDELVSELLDCGGVLSQMISAMVEYESSGSSAPDAAPIPDVARSLIRGVIPDLDQKHSEADIATAAAIVHEVTNAICEEIFFVSPELIEHQDS